MITIEWKCGYCEYDIEDPAQPAGQVKVTTLHWRCIGSDDESGNTASNIGTINAADQNRVYTLAALQAVPESVMVGWVQQALDSGDQTVADIEANVTAQVELLNTPVSGGLTPEE